MKNNRIKLNPPLLVITLKLLQQPFLQHLPLEYLLLQILQLLRILASVIFFAMTRNGNFHPYLLKFLLMESSRLFYSVLDLLLLVVLIAALVDLILLFYVKPYSLQISPVLQTELYSRYPFVLLLAIFKLNMVLLLVSSTNVCIMLLDIYSFCLLTMLFWYYCR